ncbi:MAG TPA: hypothetical protein VL978_17010 [Puia sp.]|nr:hypothetical protein [Puia sp.]
MKKTLSFAALLIAILFSIQASVHAQAQTPSLKNTNWKLFVPDLNDTITLHIKADSSYVTTTAGDSVVRSVCKVSADTLSFTDYDGQYACPNQTGKYLINLSDDANTLTLTLIDDPCDGRAGAINKIKWSRAAAPPTAQK